MSNLKVKKDCIMCGACFSLGFEFLEEAKDGGVKVKENTYLHEESPELKMLLEVCPVQAFVYDKTEKVKSSENQLEEIKMKLKNWNGLEKPTLNDLKFNEQEYTMSMPYVGGSSYVYSSERAAENAAETQFNNVAYSKIDMFILQVISQYRVAKVGPYFCYGPNTNSVYYKENMKIVELLKKAEKLSKKNLGADFSRFDVSPERDDYYKLLNKGLVVGDELVGGVRAEFKSGSYSSLSSFRMYFDTDEMEMYEGTGLFGREKYVYKYCYRSLSEAIRELEKDLRWALNYNNSDIEERAKGIVDCLIGVYNNKAKEEISKKLKLL